MISIDSKKCKPHNAREAQFQVDVNSKCIEFIKAHNLPITSIRWGRQVKSWGSTGVADYHVYEYKSDNRKEFWINMHNMEDYSEEKLLWALMRGSFRFIKSKEEVENYVTDADLTAYKLLHPNRSFTADRSGKKMREYLASKLFADSICNTSFAFQ